MIIYIGNNQKDVAKIKRLVNFKASLGVCEWAGDFKNTNINIDVVSKFVDSQLESLEKKCRLLKVMSVDDDSRFFEELKLLEPAMKAAMASGVYDQDTIKVLKDNKKIIPSTLKDVLDSIDTKSFLWIV